MAEGGPCCVVAANAESDGKQGNDTQTFVPFKGKGAIGSGG